jgi:hypothetical protein
MSTEFETVHNFFERVIFHEVAQRASGHPDMNGELLADDFVKEGRFTCVGEANEGDNR